MLHLNPYSVQFNSDPRPLHQISTNGRSMSSRSPHAHTKDAYATRGHAGKQTASASHPYIVAQQEKKKLPVKKATNNQAISSASSAHCHAAPTYLHRCRSQSQTRSNRKRKYIDTFEDDEHGQQLYTQSLIIAPPSKQHISEQTVMKSIRDDCKIDVKHIDLNSLDHTLNELSLDACTGLQSRSGRTCTLHKKRTFDQMVSECKDTDYQFASVPCKKQKVCAWTPADDAMSAHSADAAECMLPDSHIADTASLAVTHHDNDYIARTEPERLELIPSSIKYAELMNDRDSSLIGKLSRSDSMLQRMSLNQYSGALVPYKKPMASKSWQELIQTYYKNNKHCNVKEFTEIGKEHTEENQDETDCEMREKKESRKKRPIRLHSSYSGFSKNAFINSEELKKIANQCYVSNVANANRNDCKSTKLSEKELETDNESMDCD